jgi:hypothetical protein
MQELPTAAETYGYLQRHINGPSSQFEKEFKRLFSDEHPTLQQAFVRHIIVPALHILAAQRPDARNQASHDFAVAALQDASMQYFPLI